MNEVDALDIGRDAIFVLLKIGTPILLVALVVGLLISLFQALTQIQEMTLSFVPKILAIFLALIVLMPFMVTTLSDFNERLMDEIAHIE
jgi:flagellar biosynthetic protein FliQ